MDTMELLQVYLSSKYKSDIMSLSVLFTDMEMPTVKKPKEPKEITVTDKKRISSTKISKFKETIYNERIKQWICDDHSLEATIRSLYNIVRGQCSNVMKNKLTMAKNYATFKRKGEVAELLREVRRVSL